jgi:hypothetical protein
MTMPDAWANINAAAAVAAGADPICVGCDIRATVRTAVLVVHAARTQC